MRHRRTQLRAATIVLFAEVQSELRFLTGISDRAAHLGDEVSPILRNRLDVPDYVVHGFRASFGSWCQEHDVPWDLRELALAHTIGSRVEQAYLRENLLERRRTLGETWARFCDGAEQPENVVQLAGRAG